MDYNIGEALCFFLFTFNWLDGWHATCAWKPAPGFVQKARVAEERAFLQDRWDGHVGQNKEN